MNTRMNEIQKGMDVYGADGDKIGSVSDVYPNPSASTMSTTQPGDVVVEEVDVFTEGPGGTDEVDEYAVGGVGAGTSGAAGAGSGYFKVDQGGILGIGAKELYIPFDAVASVDPQNGITLTVTKDQADAQYLTKPAVLQSS